MRAKSMRLEDVFMIIVEYFLGVTGEVEAKHATRPVERRLPCNFASIWSS